MGKYIAIFVEGDTEVELYKKYILPDIKSKSSCSDFTCKVYNVKGYGGFKRQVYGKLKNGIKIDGEDELVVVLCYDTDVFDIASTPLIDWKKVDKQLKNYGASKVIHIKAKKSIEDWLCIDAKSICKWLGIKLPAKLSGNGYEKLRKLLAKRNKFYVKGRKVDGLLEKLDMKLIISEVYDQLEPLYNEFE